MPEVEELAAKYEGKAKFCKLDTGGNRRLAISQKVMGLPTIAFYKDGEKVAEFSKEFSMEEVEKKLQELI
nr:thioredoxin family protein [Syntrophaceticus schinkii]